MARPVAKLDQARLNLAIYLLGSALAAYGVSGLPYAPPLGVFGAALLGLGRWDRIRQKLPAPRPEKP